MPLIDRGSDRDGWSDKFPNGIRWAAVLGSLLLTFLAVTQEYMPNDDGVLYLLSAEQFAAGEWEKAFQLYNWPFYAILIAGVHLLSGLGVEASAYALNGLLQAILVFAFLGVVSRLGGDQRVVLIAAVLILIFPSLNEYRSNIIRGHGYWAFAMVSLLFMLKYTQQYESRYVLGWVAALAIAALFRIEGLVLLALAPLVFLLYPQDTPIQQAKRVTLVYGGYVAAMGLLLAALFFAGAGEISLKLWGKPAHTLNQFYAAVSSDLSDKVMILRHDFLTPYSDGYAWSIVVVTIVIILATEVVASIGFVFGFLAFYAWRYAEVNNIDCKWRIVWFFAAINVLMLAAFVVSLGFLTGRYPMALTLLLMLLAPFGTVALYHRLVNTGQDVLPKRKWVGVAFGFIALLLFVDGIFSLSPGKVHVEQAAKWLNKHTYSTDRVLSLDAPLLYRSGRLDWGRYLEYRNQGYGERGMRAIKELTLGDLLKIMDWRQFDYIAALVSRKAPNQQKDIEMVISSLPIKEFRNGKGDRVLIYETKAVSGAEEARNVRRSSQ